MYRQTLGGAARNWFDDLDPKSVDSFEELSQKFLEEFSQQKRYAKEPTEIHDIKRRQNEGLQAFMDRFKSKSSHIKRWTKCSKESGLSLEEKWPHVQRKWPQHQQLLSVKKADRRGYGLEEVGLSGKGYLLEQPEERGSRKEQHKSHKHDKGRGNRKRPFKGERPGLPDELTFPAIPQNRLTDEPIILEGRIEDHQVRRILVDGGSSSEIMYEHCFRNLNINIRSRLRRCRAPLIGRIGMRSLRAVGFTIHSMIKFPTNQGIMTMETSREALWECRQLERVQGSWKEEGTIRKVQHPEWVANTIPVKLENGTWKVQVDYSILNKVCAKDMYPFPEEGEPVQMFPTTPKRKQPNKNGREWRRKNRVSYGRRGILFHPHAERIKKLGGDTSKDDGKGLG
ncbi:reverse transcriptase domain-containing protein [Tanacetum coccineum]|uniref:Reverse transcriptase domain-containing protein n=1 Tax=Tanacetum coccineum TaxID=301880 RepID=A0ABQ5DFH1_9ASTR